MMSSAKVPRVKCCLPCSFAIQDTTRLERRTTRWQLGDAPKATLAQRRMISQQSPRAPLCILWSKRLGEVSRRQVLRCVRTVKSHRDLPIPCALDWLVEQLGSPHQLHPHSRGSSWAVAWQCSAMPCLEDRPGVRAPSTECCAARIKIRGMSSRPLVLCRTLLLLCVERRWHPSSRAVGLSLAVARLQDGDSPLTSQTMYRWTCRWLHAPPRCSVSMSSCAIPTVLRSCRGGHSVPPVITSAC